jgi:hypothetical protein
MTKKIMRLYMTGNFIINKDEGQLGGMPAGFTPGFGA